MKRIKAACLMQTVHFQLKDNLGHTAAVKNVQEEYATYKERLTRTGTEFRIDREETLPDGSILIEIRKQYNNNDCGKYME